MELTAAMVAQILKGTLEGNPEVKLNTFAKIEEGHEGALSFLANMKYEHHIYTTASSAVLVSNEFKPAKNVSATLIRVADPYQSIAVLLSLYEQSKPKKKGIHPTAIIEPGATVGNDVYLGAYVYISENATVGDGCILYPHVFIGEGAKLGKNCTLYSGVKIYQQCVVGNECILHAGAVVGSDGFGFAPITEENKYMKIPQVGNVVLEDNVEIGANTCIDRATMGSTFIRQGVKLDNLIQVAHNVEIGTNTVIAALTGVAGSSKVGKNCMIGGQVGIVGHISVADGCKIGAQTGVIGTIKEENSTMVGFPAIDSKQYMRSFAHFIKLPDLNKKVDEIAKAVDALKNR